MSAEQTQYWGMWATIAMTLVTGWMACRTAKMARATQQMAEVARDELDFMRAEANRTVTAHVTAELADAPVNIGPNGSSLDVTAALRLRNAGPGYADQVVWHVWLTADGLPDRVSYDTQQIGLLKDGESSTPRIRLLLGLASPQAAVDIRQKGLKMMTIFLTWRDQLSRPWALLQSYDCIPGREGWRCSGRWPTSGRGILVGPEDAMLIPAEDARHLLPELRSRLLPSAG